MTHLRAMMFSVAAAIQPWLLALARWRQRQPIRCRHLVLALLAMCLALLVADAARLDLRGPLPSTLLLDRHGQFIAEVSEADQEFGYWPMEQSPPRVVAAALALEDKRFASHPGVDMLAIGRAIHQNVTSGKRVSGASTIAMQVARLLDPGERTWWRKAREAWRAVVLTARFGREDILSAYLRLVPYGNRVHGIAYAARRYLDKPVADLSWAEIAFLSAIPQAPTRMNPFHENGRRLAIARAARLLEQLRKTDVLNAAEHEIAQSQLREIRLMPPQMRPAHSLHAVFKLKQLLVSGPARSGAEPYRVVTNLDLKLQQSVASLAASAVARWEQQGAGNAAVVLVDRATNGVLAWVGSADYFDRGQAGALDFARTPRSPGSTLKPFFYALALERGQITPATILDDLPVGVEGIANADRTYLGPLLPRQALANSRNIPMARMLKDMGVDEGYSFLRDLDLHHNEQDARHYGLGLTIGAMPVTLEHLVQAYSVLANDGKWRSLNWYPGQAGTARQLISPGVARLVTLHLADASARLPSFPRMGNTEYPFPVALKTGSSQGLRDAWTLAYSRHYLIGVWIGHADARPMHEVTGAGNAAELARQVLTLLHRDEQHGTADVSFPRPMGYLPVSICALTGKRATSACDLSFEEWFKPGQEPQQDDDAHLRLGIDIRNGLLAHAGTPARYAELRTFINLPPRYADWSAQNGLPRPPQFVSGFGNQDEFAGQHFFSTRALPVNSSAATSLSAPSLQIVAPVDGLNVLRDPSLPARLNTIALQVDVDPPVPEVLWTIDGKPYQLVSYPYTVRWPLQTGQHLVRAWLPMTTQASPSVRIVVR